MPSSVLTIISWASLIIACMCLTVVLYDIFVRGYRQKMAIMDWVWPITCLYAGPIGLYFYYRYGRLSSPKGQKAHGVRNYGTAIGVGIGVSHCGAGCTLGDIIGANIVFMLGFEIAGLALWPEYIVNFSLAFLLGIFFQYFSIVPMRGLGWKEGLIEAFKADALSLFAFEVGVFGWMALMQLVFFPVSHIHPDEVAYWFLMQIGMIIGFLTAYPMNWWLVKHGIKETM